MSKKFISLYNSAKNYKNRSRFSKVMVTNVLPPFYSSQCICMFVCVHVCAFFVCFVVIASCFFYYFVM